MRPLIGITGNFDIGAECFLLKEYYVKSINQAGGTAVILPPDEDGNIINDYISICKGFVLSGGGDIDPVFWGEAPEPGLGEINPVRDLFEISLVRKIITSPIPILGICRGCQVLNVAAGGSIVQDIVSNIGHEQNAPRSYPFHAIFIEKDTLLSSIIHNELIKVNSFHHQAVDQPGSNIQITASAPDGTVEAIELKGHPFCIGVQWHPECLTDITSELLFKALINACRLNE